MKRPFVLGVDRAACQRRPRAGGPRPDPRPPRPASSPRRAITARPSPTSSARAACRSGRSTRYFSGKDELIRLTCDQIARAASTSSPSRLAPATTTAERLAIAIAPVRRDDRRIRRRARARSRSSRPGRRRTASRASARCWPAVASGWPGPASSCCARACISGELPAWLDVDAVTRGLLALLDGLMLQRIEAGEAYRPADLERRAGAIVELLLAAAGASRPDVPEATADGVASRPMAHVQTVLGPIDPDALGFTLPHEHTQIALWHIQSRWDYWQLTRDEPVILDELARFRAAGGSGLVDLTLPGVGRDPAWLRGLADGQRPHLVMGCGWYRTAYYPPEALIDRRSVGRPRRRAGRRDRERGGGQRRPARDHRRDRDGQAVGLAGRGAGPSGGRPGGPPDRPGDHDPRASCPTSASPSSGSSRRRAPIRAGSSSATPTRTRSSTTTSRSSSAARSIEFDFLGMSFSAVERHRRRPRRRARSASSWHAATPTGSCSARTSATTRSSSATRATATSTSRSRSCRGCGPPASRDAEIETMTVANPRRLLTIG